MQGGERVELHVNENRTTEMVKLLSGDPAHLCVRLRSFMYACLASVATGLAPAMPY